MKKILLLFGISGDLGSASAKVFLEKDYSRYYFFTRRKTQTDTKGRDVTEIIVNDLSDEKNVAEAFSKIDLDSDAEYFLFDTIGGYYGGKLIADTPYEQFQKMQQINLNKSFLLAKYFSRIVAQANGGSICYTSAFSSTYIEKYKAAYSVSKSGLNHFIKVLAKESSEINMSANAVAPFIIDTAENRAWVSNISEMVSAAAVADLVHDLFKNYKIVTGNIIELPGTLLTGKRNL